MRRARPALLALAALFAAAPASASGIADVPVRLPDRAGARLSLTATGSPQTTAVKTVAAIPTIAGAYRIARRWTLSLDAALSLTSYRFAEQPRGEVARVANPVLGALVDVIESGELDLRVGLAAGAPLLTVPGGITANAAAEHADRAATAATGQSLYWLWARNAIPVVGVARLERRIEELVVRVDLQPGVLVAVNRDPSSVALLGAFEAAIQLGPVAPGLRLAGLLTSRPRDTGDLGQGTGAAFVRWERAAAFGGLEAVTGIDGPQGLTRGDQTSWGVTLGGGARF